MSRIPRSNDLVVYQKHKHGTHPGPRARNVRPALHGDTYDYLVTKYWVVVAAEPGHPLVVRTPTGKLLEVAASDPNLRRATLRERLWLLLWDRRRRDALLRPAAEA
jgi:hypothetical protein